MNQTTILFSVFLYIILTLTTRPSKLSLTFGVYGQNCTVILHFRNWYCMFCLSEPCLDWVKSWNYEAPHYAAMCSLQSCPVSEVESVALRLISDRGKMGRLTAPSLLLIVSACLLSVVPLGVVASYNIGVGIADVTGPSAEIGFVSMPSCLSIFICS